MGTADDFLDRYAALPSAERNSATERIAAPLRIVSADPAPKLLDEAAGVQSDQSLPCQNSFLSRPKKPSIAALSGLQPLADWIGYTDVDSSGGAQETRGPCTRSCARAAGRGCLGAAPVNSVYVLDDRVVLNINFTDDAKTVTREEVLGSSAVDNVPTYWGQIRLRGSHGTRDAAADRQKRRCPR